MTYTLRRAITSEAKPLVGLYSESGNGKTRSALLIAKGFCGDMSKVAMIETESGRGEAYADDPVVGGYGVISIREEFSPRTYGQAIGAAEQAKVQCLIVDSASHEWEGLGGVLGMAAENQAAGKKGPLVWQKPKMDHAREFMLRLTQTPIPLVVVCMRAKYPMEEAVVNGKKDWRRSTDLSPKQSEDILYEMFIHGWIDKAHAFHGTKYTLDVLRQIFKDGEPITVETGKRLQQWASGAKSTSSAAALHPASPSCTPHDAQDAARAGAQSAAAPGNGKIGGDADPDSPQVAAADPIPEDAKLVADVDHWIAKRKFQSAADIASFIKDEALKDRTLQRIAAAYKEISAK